MNHPITRNQFELVRPLLEGQRRRTRPRTNDLYDVLCAILYRRANSIGWRQLPPEFPAWRTVHEYHAQWTMKPRDGGEPILPQALRILGLEGDTP